MILGLCGSFAVVPALSLVTGGNRTARGVVEPVRPAPGTADLSVTSGSASLAALILSAGSQPGGAGAPALTSASGSAPDVLATAGSGSAGAAGGAPSPASPAPSASPLVSSPATTTPTTPVPVAAAPPPRPVVMVPRATLVSGAQQGVASWLNTIPAGTCANNGAPMGAVITVTNGLGVSITCKVVSRGPFVTGRIVDLAEPTFSKLGSASRGLVSVTVSW